MRHSLDVPSVGAVRLGSRLKPAPADPGSVHPGLTSLTHPSPGRRLWIQSEVAQDLLDHRPLEDGQDDLQFSAAAVRAVLHVDIESASFSED